MASIIANGTYVLGDPNTRDLYIGNGLKQGITSDGKQYIAADETVLWEGTLSSSSDVITLSEKLDNFDTYYVIMKTWNNITEITYSTCNYGNKKLKAKVIWSEGEKILMSVISYTTTDYLNFNFERLVVRRITSSGIEYVTTSWDEYNVITKVVGINRKEGN